ncbi:MAG: PRTRC system protein B [Bacteroidales bacterium]|nr:PRTRC system protein B [Bacteroidales bacterium]
MKDLTQALKETYTPKAVIVAYSSPSNRYYLESRPVNGNGAFGEAKPVSKRLIDGMVKTFSTSFAETPHGAMPSSMLYVDDRPGHKTFIWWNPPQKRNMSFVDGLSIEDGDYYVPGIVYVVRDRTLSVYAFKGSRPSAKRKLSRYPMFNVYDDCHVCLGNAKATKARDYTWSALTRYWETLFWGSTNSHLLGANPVKGNLVLALKESREKPFDTKQLLKGRYMLKDLMR